MSRRNDGHEPGPEFEASETRAMIDQGRRIQEARQETERAVGLLTVMDQWLDLVGDREHEQIRPVLVREAAAEIRRLRSDLEKVESHRTVAKRELVSPPEGCENPSVVDGEEQMCAECVACLDYISDYWYRVAEDIGSELERRDAALRDLIAWSDKYPPGRVYGAGIAPRVEAELQEVVEQGRALATGGDDADDS